MDGGLYPLLCGLPYISAKSSIDCVWISGIPVQSEQGTVRILSETCCCTFDAADVVDALQTSAPDDRLAPEVALALRRPARLLSIEPASYVAQSSVEAPKPFAFATRLRPIVAPPNSTFRSLEKRFLRELGGEQARR